MTRRSITPDPGAWLRTINLMQKDIAIVCVSNNGWVMRLPPALDDNTYRVKVIPVIDSLRTEAKIRGIYNIEFDEQLMTW